MAAEFQPEKKPALCSRVCCTMVLFLSFACVYLWGRNNELQRIVVEDYFIKLYIYSFIQFFLIKFQSAHYDTQCFKLHYSFSTFPFCESLNIFYFFIFGFSVHSDTAWQAEILFLHVYKPPVHDYRSSFFDPCASDTGCSLLCNIKQRKCSHLGRDLERVGLGRPFLSLREQCPPTCLLVFSWVNCLGGSLVCTQAHGIQLCVAVLLALLNQVELGS